MGEMNDNDEEALTTAGALDDSEDADSDEESDDGESSESDSCMGDDDDGSGMPSAKAGQKKTRPALISELSPE
jgi:hypothetical protein